MEIKKVVMVFAVPNEFLLWMIQKGWIISEGWGNRQSIGLFKTMFEGPKTEYISDRINERKVTLPQFWVDFIEFILNDVNLYQITDIEFVSDEEDANHD